MNDVVRRLSLGRTHVLLLLALPLAITAINPNWLYNPDTLNTVDTWVYNGLFRHFFDFASSPPSNTHYFIERLGWVLPGYAAYHVFPPVIANAVLHFAVYALGLFPVYGTARRLFGTTPAFLVALCMGGYTWWLRAAGHDYLDGIGIAYFSASIWCAIEAASRERGRWFLVGSGAFLALALTTQLFWAAFFPVAAIFYLMLAWERRRALIVLDGVWVALGGAAVLAAFMLFNRQTLGTADIFANSLTFVQTASMYKDQIRQAIFEAYTATPATWLVLPCLSALCAAVVFARWNRLEPELRRPFRAVVVALVLMMGVLTFFHLTSAFLYLYTYLYSSFLIPVTFLVLAGVIAAAGPPTLTARQLWLGLALTLAPLAGIIVFAGLHAVRRDVVAVWLVTGIAAAALVFALARRRPVALVGAIAAMSFMFSGHTGVAYPDRLRSYTQFVGINEIVESVDALYPAIPRFSEFIVWNDPRPFGVYGQGIRHMSQPIGIHGITRANFLSSTLDDAAITRIFMLSARANAVEDLQQLLGEGYGVEVGATLTFPSVDPDGWYHGYALTIRRLHSFNSVIVPAGENIYERGVMADNSFEYTWTGPGETVVMEFNLPVPDGPLEVAVCSILTILPPVAEIPATVNGEPFTFMLQQNTPECHPFYRGAIPAAAIAEDTVTKIVFAFPTAPSDTLFHNGDGRLLGMAIRSVSFNTQDVP